MPTCPRGVNLIKKKKKTALGRTQAQVQCEEARTLLCRFPSSLRPNLSRGLGALTCVVGITVLAGPACGQLCGPDAISEMTALGELECSG